MEKMDITTEGKVVLVVLVVVEEEVDLTEQVCKIQSNENKVTLFTPEVQKRFIENFLGENLNLAVLDSGCTKTMCGEEWLNCYFDAFSRKSRNKYKL